MHVLFLFNGFAIKEEEHFFLKDSLQDEEGLTKQNRKEQSDLKSDGKTSDGGRLKDFYKECVEMSVELNQSPSKHWFKANSEYRLCITAELK